MPSFHLPPQPSTNPDSLAPVNQLDAISVPLTTRMPSMPPWYYRFIITLLKPLYRLQVWRRSYKRDNYQQEVAQRFGKHYPPRPVADVSTDANKADVNNSNINSFDVNNKTIWCHAVSLGETNTIAPLLDSLLAQGYQIWLTNTTQTGFARGAGRFADEIAQGRLSHSYVPVDSPAVIETFLAHVQPVAALFVETELWANILVKLSQHHIPSILVNGRLSAASFTRYQKISAVSRSMMQNLTLIIAQDDESAKRFRQLGAHSAQIRVAGSLKWVINSPKIDVKVTDIKDDNDVIQKQIEKQKGGIESDIESGTESDMGNDPKVELEQSKQFDRPIWVAASTHSGEEDTALSLQQQLLSIPALAEALLIIVPRHPERFNEVAELVQKSGLQMARRSNQEAISAQTQVYLADSMGELMHWYALADVALVGGSLVDIGGHNPVEPASVATPVLMGGYTQSCQSVVDKLAGVGALYQPSNHFYRALTLDDQPVEQNRSELIVQAADADDSALIYEQLQLWLSHPQLATQAGQAGKQLTLQQQSVLTRQLTMIEEVVKQFPSSEY
ncbi:3-deoxy-D-manno-octulosonic acid transferase [Psychrobacter sp. 72-O-c]|uniref:3-deoxy-D-manno-octulosonic acid transferase n=1 Tax=Psychrobacter sp. 72-O-c TaxID=2774125 RepID=UPI001919D4D9|nr:3-deoxy-D-manno-octulosonic acid transferase [Psychrobacter sp. 72-O-c]